MPTIQTNISLQGYNTFGINATASHFVEIETAQQLVELAELPAWNLPKIVLGGGSNMLLINDVSALVIYMNNKGIEQVDENEDYVWLKVQAGENWHEFVLHAIEKNLGGVENLSLIPGNVGASPMQNIGAYGVEIKDVFVELTAFHIKQNQFHRFTKQECEFGYRSSIFKTTEKGNYIITDVTFQLSKRPKVNTSYGAIQSTLEKWNIEHPTIQDVSKAVTSIRESKLPNPKEIGNSGSFFKNPVVEKIVAEKLQNQYPEMPFYAVETGIKIPAGWLIEQCGFKGKVVGNTGTYKHQALIVVNRGNATGQEIWEFAKHIQQTVAQKFGIELEPEVNLIGG